MVPDGITSIADGAFKNNTKVKQIVLPNTVKTIGAEAFYNCSSLESINVPEGLTRIEDRTFYQCTKLASFAFPSTLKYIGSQAFMECRALETVTLNEGLTQMRSEAFKYCTVLQTLSLPSTLEVIPEKAFYYCSNLQNIQWAEGVKTIGQGAFAYANLGILVLPNSIERIESEAFQYAGVTNIVFGENIELIGNGAFSSMYYTKDVYCHLKSISFKNTDRFNFAFDVVDRLGQEKPDKCKKLKTIGGEAFSGGSFSTLTLPDTLQTIENYAFESVSTGTLNIYCDAITPPTIGERTFDYKYAYASGYNRESGKRRLKVYVVSGSEEAYKKAGGWSSAASIEAYK